MLFVEKLDLLQITKLRGMTFTLDILPHVYPTASQYFLVKKKHFKNAKIHVVKCGTLC